MIVRMSSETLNSLSPEDLNNPQMTFQFKPGNMGIRVKDSFYSMIPQDAERGTELYLRAPTASKPNTPLKLFGNVIGKFMVERDLAKVAEQLRDKTAAAEKQRSGRQTVVLDSIPDAANGGKRKPAPPARRSGAPSASASGAASPAPRFSQETLEGWRTQMVRCLATEPRQADEVLKLVGGPQAGPPARQALREILVQIADPQKTGTSSRDGPKYELKKKSWLEVRPHDYPGLSSHARQAMLDKARAAFLDLKIPDSDPAWTHIRPRPTGVPHLPEPSISTPPVSTSRAPSGTNTPTQASVQKKPATKKKAEGSGTGTTVKTRMVKVEIQAKDEGSRAPARPPPSTLPPSRKAPSPLPPAKKAPSPLPPPKPAPSPIPRKPSPLPPRKTPGSGFRASETPQEERRRTGPVDARSDRRREPPAPSGPARPAPPIAPPPATVKKEAGSIKRPKTAANADKGKGREVDEGPSRVKRQGEDGAGRARREEPAGNGTLKRKKRPVKEEEEEEEGEYEEYAPEPVERIPKKRKTEEGVRREVDRERERERERDRQSLSAKKAVRREREAGRAQRERDTSPRPVKRVKREEHSPSVSRSDSRSAHPDGLSRQRSRRRSPIYTSSDDEEDSTPSRKRGREASSPPTSIDSHPTPKDRPGMRDRYMDVWIECSMAQNELADTKRKLKRKIDQMDEEGVSTISLSDDELPDLKSLERTKRRVDAAQQELMKILEAYERSKQ